MNDPQAYAFPPFNLDQRHHLPAVVGHTSSHGAGTRYHYAYGTAVSFE